MVDQVLEKITEIGAKWEYKVKAAKLQIDDLIWWIWFQHSKPVLEKSTNKSQSGSWGFQSRLSQNQVRIVKLRIAYPKR